MPAIRKPLGEITQDDLRKLISDGWAEDELLEFKQTLPSGGPTLDRWLVGQQGVGETAKRKVLAEVVAMANSYGGDVVLGMSETEAKPHRAESLNPLPQCVDLASRFEMFARDHIFPQIPLLEIRAVVTEGDAGVVIFRVPTSRLAPHRLEIGNTKECYRRSRDRTEAMSMREIQDLTLERARGAENVNNRLSELRTRYESFCLHTHYRQVFDEAYSYCVRAVPTAAGFGLTQVHGIQEIIPVCGDVWIRFADGKYYECSDTHYIRPWTPMVRGIRSEETDGEWRQLIELAGDGAYLACAGQRTKDKEPNVRGFQIGWPLATIINACKAIDSFRQYVGADSVEYALEVEFWTYGAHRIWGLGATSFARPAFGGLVESLRLPRYSLGPPEERAQLINLIYEDFWAGVGRDIRPDRVSEVDVAPPRS